MNRVQVKKKFMKWLNEEFDTCSFRLFYTEQLLVNGAKFASTLGGVFERRQPFVTAAKDKIQKLLKCNWHSLLMTTVWRQSYLAWHPWAELQEITTLLLPLIIMLLGTTTLILPQVPMLPGIVAKMVRIISRLPF